MKIYLILPILALILSSCGNSSSKEEVIEVPMEVFEDLPLANFIKEAKSDPKAILLDVRTPGETSAGVIEGAMEIDYNSPSFYDEIGKLDKKKHYYVYCQSGIRSAQAAKLMIEIGFTQVYNLPEGYAGYENSRM